MAGRRERLSPALGGGAVRAMQAPRSQSAYLSECARGQQLLDAGQAAEAMQVFEAILASLDPVSRFERAVVLGRLGRCTTSRARPRPLRAVFGKRLPWRQRWRPRIA
ncbi:hypothetical protein D9M72_391210 [compost metagenome]